MTLSPEDQELLRHALHLGIASTEFKVKFEQGDFLIRNVLNLDQEKGFIAVGDIPRNGQTVQFHLRDARTAAEDLDLMLGNYSRDPAPIRPVGRPAVHLQRPRRIPVRAGQSRLRRLRGQGGRNSPRRIFLRRRDRPGGILDLPARLYQLLRHIQAPRKLEPAPATQRGAVQGGVLGPPRAQPALHQVQRHLPRRSNRAAAASRPPRAAGRRRARGRESDAAGIPGLPLPSPGAAPSDPPLP